MKKCAMNKEIKMDIESKMKKAAKKDKKDDMAMIKKEIKKKK